MHRQISQPLMFRVFLRRNSIKAAFEDRQFDALDSASLSSMETILDILSSASGEATAIPHELKFDNRPSTIFGREFFEYKLIRLLNDRHLIRKESKIWTGVVAKYNEFIDEIISDYRQKNDTKFADSKLDVFQNMARAYVMDDRAANHTVDREIEALVRFPRSKPAYHFPKVHVPVPVKVDTDNKFMLKKSIGNAKHELNLLSYVLNHDEFLDRFIGNYQRKHNSPVAPYQMLDAIIRTQSLEGEKIFTLLVKRVLYRVPELNNNFIRKKFLHNSHGIKVVSSHQSRILSRLLSLDMYKGSLKAGLYVRNTDKPELLTTVFNQFFAMCFRSQRLYTENWVYELMKFFQDHQFDETELRRQALANFDELLERDDFRVKSVRELFEGTRERKWRGRAAEEKGEAAEEQAAEHAEQQATESAPEEATEKKS